MNQNTQRLTHVYRIEKHPLQKMPRSIQNRYLEGLACVCYNVANGDATMGVLFSQWGQSITGEDESNKYRDQPIASIKNAISLNRVGVRFFWCHHVFYYDCYYLVESYNEKLLSQLDILLSKNGKSVFTKAALEEIHNYFVKGFKGISVPKELIDHRLTNLRFKKNRTTRVLVVATVSAGKSTMINALIGHNFCRVKTTACTDRLCEIHNKPVNDGITYYAPPSSLLHDSIIKLHRSTESTKIGLHFKSNLGDTKICLIDTPGVNNANDNGHWEITQKAIVKGRYDMILFVSNGQYNGTNDERRLLEFIFAQNKQPIIFALNKLDQFKSSEDDIGNMITEYEKELKTIGFRSPKIFPVSAQYAYLCRLDSKDEDASWDIEQFNKRFSKEYYNLPQYIGQYGKDNIGRSGISLIEFEIKKISQNTNENSHN